MYFLPVKQNKHKKNKQPLKVVLLKGVLNVARVVNLKLVFMD